jgi:tol-pal system protein YbgF
MKKMVGKSYKIVPFIGSALVVMMVSNSALAAPAVPSPSVEERLQRIERIIENPVLLQLSRRLGEQQREIQELQDQIDFLKRDLRRVNRTSDKRYKESDDRLSALESAMEKREPHNEARLELSVPVMPKIGGTVALSGGTNSSMITDEGTPSDVTQEEGQVTEPELVVEGEGEKPVESPLTPITTHPATQEEQGAYQFAFGLIKNSQYDSAIKAFQSFLDNHPQSELASNAAYWMGEAFYIKEDNQAALNAFNTVIKRYPYSSKMADAMLRAGDCYDNLTQRNQAKELYAELIALYPKTRAAEKAIKRLEKLK